MKKIILTILVILLISLLMFKVSGQNLRDEFEGKSTIIFNGALMNTEFKKDSLDNWYNRQTENSVVIEFDTKVVEFDYPKINIPFTEIKLYEDGTSWVLVSKDYFILIGKHTDTWVIILNDPGTLSTYSYQYRSFGAF
jgi:hypothetical protein